MSNPEIDTTDSTEASPIVEALKSVAFVEHHDLPGAIEHFRSLLLFSGKEDWVGLEPASEQYMLLSLAALEQAQRFAELSVLAQTRAMAETGGSYA